MIDQLWGNFKYTSLMKLRRSKIAKFRAALFSSNWLHQPTHGYGQLPNKQHKRPLKYWWSRLDQELCSTLQQRELFCPQWYYLCPMWTFSEPTLAWRTTTNRGLDLSLSTNDIRTHDSNTRSYQDVSHWSTILAQCCLTSVFSWRLVFPTWHNWWQRKKLPCCGLIRLY